MDNLKLRGKSFETKGGILGKVKSSGIIESVRPNGIKLKTTNIIKYIISENGIVHYMKDIKII